ncbi:MAG: hypothetical protein QM802_08640 [Agriterribacter sp.]
MKQQIQFRDLIIGAIAVAIIFLSSCKKDKEEDNKVTEEIQNILPQEYIDSLTAQGLELHDGNTPPVINGIYDFEPINDYDNSNYFHVGQSARDAKIKIANQAGTSADVFIKGWIDLNIPDTSSAQIIAGTGNNFTVYAQAHGGSPVYTYDYVLTGTYSSGGIQNMKFAFVMIDNGGNITAASTGTIRIFHDHDNNASTASVFRSMLPANDTDRPAGSAKQN